MVNGKLFKVLYCAFPLSITGAANIVRLIDRALRY